MVWKGEPARPYLQVEGTATNSCQDWAVVVNPPDDQQRILVLVTVVRGYATDCSEGPVTLQREILIGPFPAGKYALYLNETEIGEVIIM